jgi:3',5'-cyclic AMP phosphodiesterase CpdA
MEPFLTFIHLTDTHLGPTSGYSYHEQNPARCLERLVDVINALPQPPDFALHTGDLSDDRSAESYAVAQDILDRLRVPLYLVNGNHDDRALLRRCLDAPPHPTGDPAAPLDYAFEIKGERFLALDAHTDAVPDPLGQLSDDQLAWARSEAQPDGPPLTVLLHYPLFPMGSPWLDENMLLVNGAALHAALLPARDRLRGVFFGHLHRSCQIVRDGIRYTGAGSAVAQYAWQPWDDRPQVDPDFAPAYNVVQYFEDQVIVMQRAFARPE